MPTFGSLFAGIGGIDLGLERAGWQCRWQVERDAFCRHVLEHHWPAVPRYGDITTVDWSTVEPVDLIAGGFPCQPFSVAGRRRGKDDDRWLWPAFADAIRALRPRYVLVENVPGLLAGHGGMGSVLGDLAELGYDAEWDSIPAAAVGAPHLRYRVWIVAYPHGERLEGIGLGRFFLTGPSLGDDPDGCGRPMAGADDRRWNGRAGALGPSGWPEPSDGSLEDTNSGTVESRRGRGRTPETGQPPLADPDLTGPQGLGRLDPQWDGPGERPAWPGGGSIGEWWRVEPDVGRVAHGVPARVDRLRALGNAVVPQVAEEIGRNMMELL